MIVNLRLLREKHQITQTQLADAIGTTQQAINLYENHNTEPDIKTLIDLSIFFNTSIDYLVGNTEIDDRIESITHYHLNDFESDVMDNFRNLKDFQRDAIAQTIFAFTKTQNENK